MATKSPARMEAIIMQPLSLLGQLALQLFLLFLAQPTVYALIGTTTARILSQTGYSKEANGMIAWAVLIVCAVGSAFAGHMFLSNDPVFILGAVIGAITLLLASGLHTLRPYLIYLDWVEGHVFNVVPPPAPAPDSNATAPLAAVAPDSTSK
jgi:hypothetical protein